MDVRSVVITGNCLVGGIVEGLAAALPSVDIQGFPAWELETPEQRTLAAAKIDTAGAWLRMPLPEGAEKMEGVAYWRLL